VYAVLVVLGLGLLPGLAAAQAALDLCGCEGLAPTVPGNPNFHTNSSSSWPAGTTRVFVSPVYELRVPVPNDGILVFDSFNANNSSARDSRVVFTRPASNAPVQILVKGNVNIASGDLLRVDGGNGGTGNATVAGAGGDPNWGGAAGGDGAYRLGNLADDGGAGIGFGGGLGGRASDLRAAAGGEFSGSTVLNPVLGGSGGGGGFSNGDAADCTGGGGGASGGGLLIAANGSVTITGTLSANGGDGGAPGNADCASGGGGGSGGAIRIVTDTLTGSGRVEALGGAGGGATGADGAPGRLRFEALTNTFGANTSPPAARVRTPGALTTAANPAVFIQDIEGATVPELPQGFLNEIDIIVSAPGLVGFGLESRDVPAGTELEVSVKPNLGGDPILQRILLDAGDCQGGACTVRGSVLLTPGGYVFEARATFEVPVGG